MGNRTVTIICNAADKAAGQALGVSLGDGQGTFSVPLSTTPNATDLALVTHWGMSGQIPEEEVTAFNVNLAPMFKVFDMQDGQTFYDHLAMCVPPLYRVIPNEVM